VADAALEVSTTAAAPRGNRASAGRHRTTRRLSWPCQPQTGRSVSPRASSLCFDRPTASRWPSPSISGTSTTGLEVDA